MPGNLNKNPLVRQQGLFEGLRIPPPVTGTMAVRIIHVQRMLMGRPRVPLSELSVWIGRVRKVDVPNRPEGVIEFSPTADASLSRKNTMTVAIVSSST